MHHASALATADQPGTERTGQDMSKSVPWPAPRPTTGIRCGVVSVYTWGDDYEAPCILAPGHHDRRHYDGVTRSKLPACGGCGEELIAVPGTAGQRERLGLPEWAHASGSKDHAGRPETVDEQAERHDHEMFGDPDAEPEWATAGYDPAAR